jgi:hypothetical protein
MWLVVSSGGRALPKGSCGKGTGKYVMDNVHCNGEYRLGDCYYVYGDKINCDENVAEDATVACDPVPGELWLSASLSVKFIQQSLPWNIECISTGSALSSNECKACWDLVRGWNCSNIIANSSSVYGSLTMIGYWWTITLYTQHARPQP